MSSKLLLLNDVEHLGRSGDIVSVRPGYARNFLLPQGLGILASKGALKMQARLQEERLKKALQDKQESEQQSAALAGVTIETAVKVDHEGNMYGSVSAGDIVHLLENQASVVLEKHTIQLKHPLKQTGVHTISVRLREGVTASFTLKIVPENAKEAAAAGASK